MNKRQPPIVRAGSGDSHEARLAVLEQRFSDDMQARCSWCNQVASAKQGEWLEVLISSPGTGIRPAHVFRCLGCEGAPAAVRGGIVAVPSGVRRPGQVPPPPVPAPAPSGQNELHASDPRRSGKSASTSRRVVEKSVTGDKSLQKPSATGGPDRRSPPDTPPASQKARKRPQAPVFPGKLSPAP